MMKNLRIVAACIFVLIFGVWAVLNIFAPRPVNTDQKASVKLNPPPKPPNCPDYPELANLKLKDGSIADVRIIQDGEQKFYIPFDWYTAPLKWNQVNGSTHVKDYLAIFAGKWDPDMSEIECPGVLHVGAFNYITPQTPTYNNTNKHEVVPNFSSEGRFPYVDFRSFSPGPPLDPIVPFIDRTKGDAVESNAFSATLVFKLDKDHWGVCDHFPYDDMYKTGPAMIAGPIWEAYRARAMASTEYQNWRQSVHELYGWLKTPPKDRDNNRVFILGAK